MAALDKDGLTKATVWVEDHRCAHGGYFATRWVRLGKGCLENTIPLGGTKGNVGTGVEYEHENDKPIEKANDESIEEQVSKKIDGEYLGRIFDAVNNDNIEAEGLGYFVPREMPRFYSSEMLNKASETLKKVWSALNWSKANCMAKIYLKTHELAYRLSAYGLKKYYFLESMEKDGYSTLSHVLARRCIQQAEIREPDVTSLLRKAVGDFGDITDGLPYRLKSEASLARKIYDKVREGTETYESCGDKITDALRYTVVSDGDNLVKCFFAVCDNLREHDYKVIQVHNTLAKKGMRYRGINTLVMMPDGYVFELQFHTPLSFYIKDRRTHKLYEKYRRLDESSEEREEIKLNIIRISDKIPNMPQLEKIGSFDFEGALRQISL